MNAYTNHSDVHGSDRKARNIGCPRPGSERFCRLWGHAAKAFVAGVPALTLVAAAAWLVNLPELDLRPEMAVWIRTLAILITVPAALGLYRAIARLKERGYA